MENSLVQKICRDLAPISDPEYLNQMRRFGIIPRNAWGIKMSTLRSYAKQHQLKHQHELALQLWDESIHETKLLASIIDNPCEVTPGQMEEWVKDFYSWDIVDNTIGLFVYTDFARQKALEWVLREPEYEKRVGFVMMVALAVHDKDAPDQDFLDFFPYLKVASCDGRKYVKKAVNWAIRQIGKRNRSLNHQAILLAEEIRNIDCKPARWIASDALRELKSDKVIARLEAKAKKLHL